jgi:hypothetical protein
MAVFDFEKESQTGVWFDLAGGGRVKLRTPGFSEWRKIRAATVHREPFVHMIDGKPVVLNREQIDEDSLLEMQWDESIIEWEGIFDGNGNEIPCTKEMKTALMTMRSPIFRDFYAEKMKTLMDAEEAAVEASEKN